MTRAMLHQRALERILAGTGCGPSPPATLGDLAAQESGGTLGQRDSRGNDPTILSSLTPPPASVVIYFRSDRTEGVHQGPDAGYPKWRPTGSGDLFALTTAPRTTGATLAANSSITRATSTNGRPPMSICARKRWWPNSSRSYRILSIICCGLPTKIAPCGAARSS